MAYSFFSIIDGNVADFKINNAYVTLLGEWGSYIMAFYFTGRSVEKVATRFFEYKEKEKDKG